MVSDRLSTNSPIVFFFFFCVCVCVFCHRVNGGSVLLPTFGGGGLRQGFCLVLAFFFLMYPVLYSDSSYSIPTLLAVGFADTEVVPDRDLEPLLRERL